MNSKSEFKQVTANKMSIMRRKKVYGIGINDAEYMVTSKGGGNWSSCHYYNIWRAMIERCYSEKSKVKHPTYSNCTVSDDWLRFSNFKGWMIKQDFHGKELDKDIKITGNAIYSEDTCLFVSKKINNLFLSCKASRTHLPLGVSARSDSGKYQSSCHVNGKKKYLGTFDTPEAARCAYIEFKYKHVLTVAGEQDEPLRGFLIRIAEEIKSGEYLV